MLDAARAQTRVGARETEIAAALATIPLSVGGECSFEPTVIAGIDDPVPIRRSTARTLKAGDSVMVDVGAALEGYQGDATRTFVLGPPSSAQLEAWDVVRRAYDAALDLARPGVPCKELHRVSSEIIEGAGFAVAQRIGHGIGLATSYEWPSLDTEEASLEPGMTICIEPGVYAPGIGNMKLEDDLIITDERPRDPHPQRRDAAGSHLAVERGGRPMSCKTRARRGAGAVERGGLENRYLARGLVSSNLTPAA